MALPMLLDIGSAGFAVIYGTSSGYAGEISGFFSIFAEYVREICKTQSR
jgi:hypothetical protein